eukprot:352534-Chlamydomonas_euryale.AAC.8
MECPRRPDLMPQQGTWVSQGSWMLAQTSDGPWSTTTPSDGRHGKIQAQRGPGRCDLDDFGRVGVTIASWTCAMGGSRLVVEGGRGCLFPWTRRA